MDGDILKALNSRMQHGAKDLVDIGGTYVCAMHSAEVLWHVQRAAGRNLCTLGSQCFFLTSTDVQIRFHDLTGCSHIGLLLLGSRVSPTRVVVSHGAEGSETPCSVHACDLLLINPAAQILVPAATPACRYVLFFFLGLERKVFGTGTWLQRHISISSPNKHPGSGANWCTVRGESVSIQFTTTWRPCRKIAGHKREGIPFVPGGLVVQARPWVKILVLGFLDAAAARPQLFGLCALCIDDGATAELFCLPEANITEIRASSDWHLSVGQEWVAGFRPGQSLHFSKYAQCRHCSVRSDDSRSMPKKQADKLRISRPEHPPPSPPQDAKRRRVQVEHFAAHAPGLARPAANAKPKAPAKQARSRAAKPPAKPAKPPGKHAKPGARRGMPSADSQTNPEPEQVHSGQQATGMTSPVKKLVDTVGVLAQKMATVCDIVAEKHSRDEEAECTVEGPKRSRNSQPMGVPGSTPSCFNYPPLFALPPQMPQNGLAPMVSQWPAFMPQSVTATPMYPPWLYGRPPY